MAESLHTESVYGNIPIGLPGGFFVYEAHGKERILFADGNVIGLFGCVDLEDFLDYTGGTFTGMVHPDDLHKIENEITAQTMFGEKRHDYVRYRIRTKQGEVRYIEDFGHLLHGVNGMSFFYVFIVDVDQDEYFNRSKNSLAEAQILSMNQETDALTGLFNMSFFYQKVQMFLQTIEARRMEVAFIHFDIPNFKLFNERHGFRVGDELLCDVAKLIRAEFTDGADENGGSIRNATVARFSDDHFLVCCGAGSRETILSRVENVQKSLLLSEDANKRVRIKAGIYYLDDRMPEVGLACDHARLACNSVKGRHDINYCVYDEMLREKLRRQQYVIDHIDEAVEKAYIKVFYQPVIRVRTGEVCGAEALVRWIDPTVGFLSPADFIETLEQFHLIHKVDEYVVEQVCRDYRALKDAGEPVVPVSVNLSRLDFELCDIVDYIERMREKYDVPRSMLDLEITESVLNDNSDLIKTETTRLREAGYHIWIDDFGSGYSSLNVLTEYEFDVLKLDLVFLRSYDHNPRAGKLISYVIQLARGLDVEPLTEGVETEAHFAFLKDAGCERAQGYYFSKPQPLDELKKTIAEKGLAYEAV